MSVCRVCSNSEENTFFDVKEMVYGTRVVYQYMECGACQCVQIMSPPDDMSEYYDNQSYGSFLQQKKSFFTEHIRQTRNRYAIRKIGGLIGKILTGLKPLPRDFTIIGEYAVSTSRILDVGCGAGLYVNDLREVGFEAATGIDPFVKEDLHYQNGTVIRKMHIEEVSESYEVILCHHTLEHVQHPLGMLVAIKQRLTPGGICILTIPVAEDVYRRYKAAAFPIQAPQHCYLFSIKAAKLLAKQAGFNIDKDVREVDTNLEWYMMSEFWARNIASNEIDEFTTSSIYKSKIFEIKETIKKIKNNFGGDNLILILRN